MVKGNLMHSHLQLLSLEPKKLLAFNINGMLCYFPPLVVLQGNVRVFGKNVDKTKVESKLEWQIFLVRHFQSFISQFGLV